jgi:DNA-binding MarR family transcriptional regulator
VSITRETESELWATEPLRAVADHFAGHPMLGHMLATTAVLRAAKVVNERAEEALAPLGLTMNRYKVLGLIDSAGGRMSLRDLKRATMLHAATMTGTIDALADGGFLSREFDADNRRVVIAELTERGREAAGQALQALTEVQFGLPDFTEEEALQLAGFLARVGDST